MNIPKIFFTYWDGNYLSLLNIITIRSFHDLNPEWKIKIYIPMYRHIGKNTWTEDLQSVKYTGKNYMDELYLLDYVEIIKIDFEKIGFKNDIPEVFKSDYLRYYILSTDGGMWSDMDIVHIKPIELLFNDKIYYNGDINNIDTVICMFLSDEKDLIDKKINYLYNKIDNINCINKEDIQKDIEFMKTFRKYNVEVSTANPELYNTIISLMLSAPNNSYFLNLKNNCHKYYNENSYESLGANMCNKLYPTRDSVIEKHPELNILFMNREQYSPYEWYNVEFIFGEDIPEQVTDNTFGIHWYNGLNKTKKYQNDISNNILPINGSIYKYIKKYLY